jgi:hypothetical protein
LCGVNSGRLASRRGWGQFYITLEAQEDFDMLTSIIKRLGFAVIGSACLIGSATAADMTGAEIKTFLSGKSVYLENTATSTGGAGQGVIYYAEDGTALFKTAKGPINHGKWTIKENTACIEWKEVPNNPCSKYDKQGDTITVINVATGQSRGKIVKAVAGNPEKIAP